MATEKRFIDANAADVNEINCYYGGNCRIEDVEEWLNEQPTVDAVEVVHGQWEQVQRWATKAKYRCSVCGREIMSAAKVNIEKYPFCHCGAKMDGERKDHGKT